VSIELSDAAFAESPAKVSVRVQKISKSFGRFKALDAVSFEMRQGEVLGFLGPNGAGKTTTVRILTGFFPPSEGKIWIGDIEMFKHPREAKQRIGYLPESVSLYGDMRVHEFLEFVAAVKGVPRKKRKEQLEEKLTQCGLWEVRRKLIGFLSKGYRQRVGIAQALIGDPELLVLDEPTNGLDPKQVVEIRSLIRELGKNRSLIVSTHILPEVNMLCDRVLIMNRGRVVASGTTEELEKGLKKTREVYVMVEAGARRTEILGLFQSMAGVDRVGMVEEKEGQTAFSIMISTAEDLRPAISRLCVENKIPLLEMRAGRLSLEEIFMKIVTDEGESRRVS